jgi:hypothetical protein
MSPLESFLHLLDIICMAGSLFYTLSGAIIYQRKENTVFSSSQAIRYGTAKGNSKDDLSEIRFVFGVSPLW